jgi:hypothetical protein
MLKYGAASFERCILAMFDNVAAACYHEQAAIVAFNTLSPNGYNLSAGAPYTQYTGPMSDDSRAQISRKLKGREFTPEWRDKISKAQLGQKRGRRSAEICAKISRSHKGKPSPLRGRSMPAEQRAKISAAQKGKPRAPITAETRAKMSAAHQGKKLSEAHRQRISEGRLAGK